jgi:hypothetical protein
VKFQPSQFSQVARRNPETPHCEQVGFASRVGRAWREAPWQDPSQPGDFFGVDECGNDSFDGLKGSVLILCGALGVSAIVFGIYLGRRSVTTE